MKPFATPTVATAFQAYPAPMRRKLMALREVIFRTAAATDGVGELEEIVGILQPTLSQQLGVLRDEGLVSTRRDGKNIYYSVASPATLEILAVLYRLYCPEPD